MTAGTVVLAPKIVKHDDANGFAFFNDGATFLTAGANVTIGGLTGILTSPVAVGQNGYAEFLTGPATAWRMYLTTGILAAIQVGDEVVHPTTARLLGYAISRGQKFSPLSVGVAAVIGAKTVAFVSFNAMPAEIAGPSVLPLVNEYSGFSEVPLVLPAVDGSGNTIVGSVVYVDTINGVTSSIDSFLATLDASALSDSYTIKIQNTGNGTLTKVSDVTGEAVNFTRNEYVTVIRVGDTWQWI
jgi:hypothetical protein